MQRNILFLFFICNLVINTDYWWLFRPLLCCWRYGTGCFMLKNTGTTVRRERNTELQSHHFSCRLNSLLFSPQPVISDHGLLTTVAYKLGKDDPACYALEVGFALHCSVLPEQTCWHAEAPPRVPYLWIPSNLFARLVVTIESCPPTILGRFVSAVVALSDWLNMQQRAAWFWPAQSFFFSSSQGSVAIAGAVVRWLRDNLGIIKSSAEIGSLFIMSKLFSNHAVIMQISLKDFFCPHCLRDTGSNSWNVLRLLLCSGFLWTLRPLLGAKCKRVKQLSKHVTHSCCRDNGHETSPGSDYKWWKWSRLQNYLWPHPVHQQEPLGLCRPRGRLLPDQRGEDHLPLRWGDRWRKHRQNSGILGINVVNIVKTAEYIQMSM